MIKTPASRLYIIIACVAAESGDLAAAYTYNNFNMIPMSIITRPIKKDQIPDLGRIAAAGIEIQIFKIAVIAARTGIGSVAYYACGDARLSCAPADKICAP